MDTLRVTMDGLTASFRHPHFIYGRQPSYSAPPPSTLYGLICAARGVMVPRRGLQVACVFHVAGRADDLEHLHIATAGSGRPRGDWPYPVNLEATVTPFQRETLFFPRLELYFAAERDRLEELEHAFRCPRYALSLGRSQDLATVRAVERVDLRPIAGAYLEPGLYPASARRFLRTGHLVTMPVEVDLPERIGVRWGRFVVTDTRVRVNGTGSPELWLDPNIPLWKGAGRGLIFFPLDVSDA